MTAISAPRISTRATPFERTLLQAASALDRFVARRLARRGAIEHRHAAAVRLAYSLARDAAQARGALGLLPR